MKNKIIKDLRKLLYIIVIFSLFSCSDKLESGGGSVVDYIDNVITGEPIEIEISEGNKVSIKISSDTLYRNNNGNTIMFGGVYADLFNDEGIKSSQMHSDSAIIYNNADSVKASGNIVVESLKGYKLLTSEIILYNDTKLVYSNKDVIFTSNRNDTLHGTGFWSNYDMTSSKILKPKGVINN